MKGYHYDRSVKKKWACLVCDYSSENKTHLGYHKKTHSEVRCYDCDVCSSSFKLKHKLKEHIKKVHLQASRKKCLLCSTTFTNAVALRRHISTTHEGHKMFLCPKCNKSFTQSGSRNRHLIDCTS